MEETKSEKKADIGYRTIIPIVSLAVIFACFIPILKEELLSERLTLISVIVSPIIWLLTLIILYFAISIVIEASKILKNNKQKKNKLPIFFIIINCVILCLAFAISIFDIVFLIK